jgi:hypothetical protein
MQNKGVACYILACTFQTSHNQAIFLLSSQNCQSKLTIKSKRRSSVIVLNIKEDQELLALANGF